MIIMIVIFLLSGLIPYVSSIRCYTCSGPNFHCTLPLNFDVGDGSNENENDINISNYDPSFACQSEYTFNPKTGSRKLILRGVKHCREINKPNHRVDCCYEDNCNNQVPDMMIRTLDKISVEERRLSSIKHRSVSSIRCYACSGPNFHCTLPLNFDAGDESNENEINSSSYDPSFACQSEYTFNPRTGSKKLILRGVEYCTEINIPNYRVDCCYEDNCNNQIPDTIIRTLDEMSADENDSESNSHRSLSSILLIIFSLFILRL